MAQAFLSVAFEAPASRGPTMIRRGGINEPGAIDAMLDARGEDLSPR